MDDTRKHGNKDAESDVPSEEEILSMIFSKSTKDKKRLQEIRESVFT